MEFQTEAQKACYEKVVPWVKEVFDKYAVIREDVPVFGIMSGSVLTQVGISPWVENETTITCRAYIVTDVELSPDLLLYLLQENDRMRFGAFGVDKDQDIFFEHSILGSAVDKDELKTSILAVAITADEYDDKIIERWGGQRMLEQIKD